MRKTTAIALASAAAVAASPALARDGAWYVGGDFGAMIVEGSDVDVNLDPNAVEVDYDYGYDSGLYVGYDLGTFRIEGEVAYKKADIDDVYTTISLPGGTPTGIYPADGNTKALSFMVNGLVDFGDEDAVSGFVGGGLGWARVELDDLHVFSNSPAPFLDDKNSGFAWQVIAGLRQAVSDNMDVTIKYRFFNVDDVTFNDGFDVGETRFRSHSLLGGLTFNFGAPEPPPPAPVPVARPAPPPPAPPPPPQMRTCPDGSRIPMSAQCPVPPAPQVPRTGENG